MEAGRLTFTLVEGRIYAVCWHLGCPEHCSAIGIVDADDPPLRVQYATIHRSIPRESRILREFAAATGGSGGKEKAAAGSRTGGPSVGARRSSQRKD